LPAPPLLDAGAWHSFVILWVVSGTYSGVTDWRGHTNSTCYDLGVIVYTIVIVVLTAKLMLETHYFTWINWFGFYFSVGIWFVWCFGIHLLEKWVPETGGSIYHLAGTAGYWFVLGITPFVALLRDVVWKFAKRNYFPQPYHLVQEALHCGVPLDEVDLETAGTKGSLGKVLFAKAARAAAAIKSGMGQGYAFDGVQTSPR
jgi:magnesium-transporting ATPase (P-type)